MKKLLSGLFAVTALSLFITGCTKTTPTEQTADVIVYSLVIKPNQWLKAENKNNLFLFKQSIPELDQDINGYIAWIYFSTDSYAYGDPGRITYGRHTFSSFQIGNGKDRFFQFMAEDNQNPPAPPTRDIYVKIGITNGANTIRFQNMPDKSYNAVKAAFNLKD